MTDHGSARVVEIVMVEVDATPQPITTDDHEHEHSAALRCTVCGVPVSGLLRSSFWAEQRLRPRSRPPPRKR